MKIVAVFVAECLLHSVVPRTCICFCRANLRDEALGICRIYRFKQCAWLAKYNNHNTQKRTKAKTNFEKDLYKLMNNVFFGKTMDTMR